MTKSKASKKPTVLELFAGVGGFRLGLEKSGWKINWSNQWEPSTKIQHASSCYVRNFGPEGHSNEDIRAAIDKHVSGERLIPAADMIVGGFPCQDYSVAKSLKSSLGLEGKKGVLWWEILRLVSTHEPKVVFLENVDRLLKSPANQRGRDFAVMLRTLGDLGYFIEWRVVNAAHFGFPQRRIRVFIVAVKSNLRPTIKRLDDTYFDNGLLPSVFRASSYENQKRFLLSDNPEEISNNFNRNSPTSPFLNAGAYLGGEVITAQAIQKTLANSAKLKDVLVPDSAVPKEYWIDANALPQWEYLKGAKKLERTSKGGHSYFYSEGSMTFPDSLTKPSRTILTGEGGSSPSRFKHVIKTRKGYRRLLPIELERLSGFPDDWTKYDESNQIISDSRRAFFVGNALIVGLVELIGAEIKQRYFG